MELYNAVGTTGTYEGHGVAPEVLNAYKELWDKGELTVRARLGLSPAFKSMAEAERDMERWSHSASGGGFRRRHAEDKRLLLQSTGEAATSPGPGRRGCPTPAGRDSSRHIILREGSGGWSVWPPNTT